MSNYGQYGNPGGQPQSGPGSPFYTEPRPPITPAPGGYQQSPISGTPNTQFPYGNTPQGVNQSQGHSQEQGYFPNQPQPAVDNQGAMGGLTSQMGGMGLGADVAPSRPNKKKNRHAYHNLDQQTVASQAFNQSVRNAPQYVNQETVEPANSGHPYGGQQVTPSMNQFPAQSNHPFSPGMQSLPNQANPPFSPGLQSSSSPAFGNANQSMPVPSGPGVSAQGRVDPEQIPSIPRARDAAAEYYLYHTYPTMEQHLPPPGVIPFVAQDQGNSSPKYARLTLNNIPSSSDALATTGLPLGLLLQPFAPLQVGERPIPVLDFGEIGPPRCRRCRAYINPFMVFRAGGNKLVCNMCTFPNDVSPEYFAPTDPTGVRVDRAQRPELTTGTVEYLVPKEYWAKEPVGLRWLFVIDVSQDAVEKGFLEAFCQGILQALYGEDEEAVEEETNGESSESKRRIPLGSKVGFVTFDKAMQFYNCNVCCDSLVVIPSLAYSLRKTWSKPKCWSCQISKSLLFHLAAKGYTLIHTNQSMNHHTTSYLCTLTWVYQIDHHIASRAVTSSFLQTQASRAHLITYIRICSVIISCIGW